MRKSLMNEQLKPQAVRPPTMWGTRETCLRFTQLGELFGRRLAVEMRDLSYP